MSDILFPLNEDFVRLRERLNCTPAFWWRDDDLAEATPQLQRLSEFAAKHGLSCLLSAISARIHAKPSEWDRFGDQLRYACHGLHHKNCQWLGLFPSEFGRTRSCEDVERDLAAAWSFVSSGFGSRAIPVMVPPWNRFDPKHYSVLAQSAFRGFSAFAPSGARLWPSGIKRIDVHLDIMDWRANPVALDREVIVARLKNLMRRIAGNPSGASNPLVIGILTHHRVMEERAWFIFEEVIGAFRHRGMEGADPRQRFGG